MTDPPDRPATPVVVVGFDMPFWLLVRFLIKVAIASIPAGIIAGLCYFVIAMLATLLMEFGHRLLN